MKKVQENKKLLILPSLGLLWHWLLIKIDINIDINIPMNLRKVTEDFDKHSGKDFNRHFSSGENIKNFNSRNNLAKRRKYDHNILSNQNMIFLSSDEEKLQEEEEDDDDCQYEDLSNTYFSNLHGGGRKIGIKNLFQKQKNDHNQQQHTSSFSFSSSLEFDFDQGSRSIERMLENSKFCKLHDSLLNFFEFGSDR